jgi:hypothetical protein
VPGRAAFRPRRRSPDRRRTPASSAHVGPDPDGRGSHGRGGRSALQYRRASAAPPAGTARSGRQRVVGLLRRDATGVSCDPPQRRCGLHAGPFHLRIKEAADRWGEAGRERSQLSEASAVDQPELDAGLGDHVESGDGVCGDPPQRHRRVRRMRAGPVDEVWHGVGGGRTDVSEPDRRRRPETRMPVSDHSAGAGTAPAACSPHRPITRHRPAARYGCFRCSYRSIAATTASASLAAGP